MKIIKEQNLPIKESETPNRKIILFDERRNPNSLSNIAFMLSERLRNEKFPFLKNTGYEDAKQAVRYVVNSAPFTSEGIAKALNDSGLGYRNWRPMKSDPGSSAPKITAEDHLGNKYYMVVKEQ